MSEKTELVKKLIGDYPPTFSTDYSPYRNCYAHALNCNYEDRDYSIYTPGAIYAEFNGNEIFEGDGKYFFDYDLFIKLIKRDCSVLSITASACTFDSTLREKSCKIALTYSKADNDFHFLRQNSDGIWSHKPGFAKFDRFGNLLERVKSEIFPYNGEKSIEIDGSSYKVFEIMELHKNC